MLLDLIPSPNHELPPAVVPFIIVMVCGIAAMTVWCLMGWGERVVI